MLPGTPLALAVTADGTQIWAARKGAIDLVDIATARRIGERKLSGTPIDMAITDDRAVVVQAGGKVAILDLGTGRLVRRVSIAGAAGVSIDSDGHAWVSATTPRKGRRRPASRVVRVVAQQRRDHLVGRARHRRRRRPRRLARRRRTRSSRPARSCAASTARPRWSTSPSAA